MPTYGVLLEGCLSAEGETGSDGTTWVASSAKSGIGSVSASQLLKRMKRPR